MMTTKIVIKKAPHLRTGKMLVRNDILFFSWLFLQPAGEGVWGRGTRRDPIPIKRYSFPLDSFDRRNKVAE
jgi:hypothetical protein